MSKSVQNIINNSQPASTEATIRQASKTKNKDTKVWIVAEGDDDAALYGKMYDKYFVQVLPSTNEKGKKSCRNVETIVSNILADSTIKIIGIRDKDYTPFTGYTQPPNIFLTDRRDIEMQILEVKLNHITPCINSDTLAEVFHYARQVGYYRIFNDRENLGFCFDDIDTNNYWDFSLNRLNADWRTSLEGFFLSNIQQPHTVTALKSRYDILETQLNNGNHTDYDLCQGHEVVNLLKRTGLSMLSQLENDLFRWYGKSDYATSNLAINIASWAQANSCRM